MKYLIVFGFILFNACAVIPLSKNDPVKINSINVYIDFQERGYTTVGAFTHFDDMKKEGTEMITVTDGDIKKIEQILKNSQRYKHYQTKVGGNIIFCKIIFERPDYLESRIIVRTGVEVSVITDLTDRKDYVIKDSSDKQWLSDFAERMKNN